MEFPSFPIPAPTPSAKPAPTQVDAVTAESAKEFEAMFLGQMVDEMLSTVDIGSIAEQNTTGIARSIETAMQRYQTGADR